MSIQAASVSQPNVYHRRGLYIPDDDRWPIQFRGLSMRIEDSVCVQSEHPLVLTTEAVKEVCVTLLAASELSNPSCLLRYLSILCFEKLQLIQFGNPNKSILTACNLLQIDDIEALRA